MRSLFFVNTISLIIIFSHCNSSFAQLQLGIELGQAWQERNDIQIPSTSGTRVEFDNFDSGPFFHYRAELLYQFSKKHKVRAVYAPFQIEAKGVIQQPVLFDDETFNASEELKISYKFNSYRLSYIYGFWGFNNDQLNIGVTAKVRDAEIEFQQAGRSAAYDNVGFVPLLYFEYQKSLSSQWMINFNTDLAVAPQGRAADLSLKLRRKFSNSTQLGIGGRTLEGGADNEKVFTFSWFNYAVADFIFTF